MSLLKSIWFADISKYPLPQWTSSLPTAVYTVTNAVSHSSAVEKLDTSHPSTYPVIALGGTFDHLHSGHKILLSMSAWIAHEKVIVGTTGTYLLSTMEYR